MLFKSGVLRDRYNGEQMSEKMLERAGRHKRNEGNDPSIYDCSSLAENTLLGFVITD